MISTAGISRRQFLGTTGALLIYGRIPNAFAAEPLPRSVAANPELDTWLRIDRDGTVTAFSGKCELGQGIRTALAQIVADELELAIDRVRVATVDTAHSPNEGRTVGSNSIPDGGGALRMAGAEARELLLQNAARRLGVSADRLELDDGTIIDARSGLSTSYWELLSGNGFDTRITGEAEVKNTARYRYVGKPVPRTDLPAKVFGEAAFIHDIVLPGMRHARIVRSEIAAATLISVDDSAGRDMPGVVSIVRDNSFLAVVAEREEQAVAAADELRRASNWEGTAALPESQEFSTLLPALPSKDTVISTKMRDSSAAVRMIEARYSRPFIAHASLGPSCALAQWDGSMLTVYSHAQGMYPLRDAISTVVGLERSQIRCIHADGPGCYGHNGADDVACDAALIALAHQGTPIRLVWSRHDEFRNEPFGSAMSLKIAAGVDAANRITNWRYDLWSCSHSTRPAGGDSAGGMLAAREKSNPLPEPRVTDLEQPVGGADRNAVPLYIIPNQTIVEHLVLDPPLRNSALRSLGAHGNVFAIESFMDELARSAELDPIEFRLNHLDDPRGRAVIEAVREMAARRPPAQGGGHRVGRGVGFARYKNLSTYFAAICEVEVDRRSGAISLRRVFAAVDAGQVVNPDGLKNQIEGGIVQSASWALKERVAFSTERIESVDWASYPILRFDEVPKIDVRLIDRPELPFVGAGEAAQGPVAAAIANAIADATGRRLRDLPLTSAQLIASRHESGRMMAMGKEA